MLVSKSIFASRYGLPSGELLLEFMAFSDRKYGFSSLYFSVVFLLLGYMFGGIVIRLNEQLNSGIEYLSKEYIYSMVYGALLYTALVILVSDEGQESRDESNLCSV